MAVAFLQEMDVDITEQYDAVTEKLNVHNDPPPGLIIHTAGRTADGGFRHLRRVGVRGRHSSASSRSGSCPAIAEVAGDGPPPGAPTQRNRRDS